MTQTIETPTTGTATTAGARTHAREQHGKTVDTMRFVPAASAPHQLLAGMPVNPSPDLLAQIDLSPWER
ncbi:hypothetical protein [Acidovorax sp. BLS4]|uniref:hypothetical protein n=1 Tax=Acidovorax sp. BLS4 TaxID=3273430 RepID=UPI002942CD8C|nr:hypothetical protein [Paracidovorax avenae]WOI45601.1 hypothetical protein R1Z03_24640 [Paracidovorax avenae]